MRTPAVYHGMENSRPAAFGIDANQLSDQACIPYRDGVMVGELDGTIARAAKMRRCDLIVMGSNGCGALHGSSLGLVVTQAAGSEKKGASKNNRESILAFTGIFQGRRESREKQGASVLAG